MDKSNQSSKHFLKMYSLFLPLKIISGQSDPKSWRHGFPILNIFYPLLKAGTVMAVNHGGEYSME